MDIKIESGAWGLCIALLLITTFELIVFVSGFFLGTYFNDARGWQNARQSIDTMFNKGAR